MARVRSRLIKSKGRTFKPVIVRAGYSDTYSDRYEGVAAGYRDIYEGSYDG